MSLLRFAIGGVFIVAVTAAGVVGYLSVPTTPVAVMPAASAAEVAADGNYGPEWPICRDMTNDPRERLRTCTNLLDRKVLTPQHQSWALNNRGTAQQDLERYKEAILDFTAAINIDSKNHAPYVNLAGMAQRQGRAAEALELVDKALALKPEEPFSYCVRARALRDLGRNKDALATIDDAEKLGPLSDCALLVRAELLENEGETTKALTALADVSESDEQASHAMCERARLLVDKGKTREAFELYRQGMELDPANACAAKNAAFWAPYVMDYEKALAFVEQAIETHPKVPALLCDRGAILKMMGRDIDALKAYNEAIDRAPLDHCGYAYRAEVSLSQGDLRAALANFELAARLERRSGNMLRRRGDVLVRLERWDEALVSYGAALKRNPKDSLAYQARAETELLLQFYPEAVADFAAAIQLRPDDAYLLYRAAVAHVAAQSPEAAIAACGKLHADEAKWAECRQVSAEAKVLTRDLPGAIQELALIPKDMPIRRHSELLLAGLYLMNGERDAAQDVIGKHRAAYPEQPYGAIWSALLSRASGEQPAANIQRLAHTNDIWPTPILRWLIDGGDENALLDAAETPDLHLTKQRRGDAEFYLGLAAMLDGAEKEASRHFAAAMKIGYLEHDPAVYPATYGNTNDREFVLASWAARGGR